MTNPGPVTRIPFRALPLAIRLATFLTFFLSWVLFAELVIDRYGLDEYLPFYRVGNICIYDLVVIALLVWLWFRWNRAKA